MADADEVVGDLADAIQLGNRHDVFVRGDLEDAVGRRVDDRPARLHVLGSELVDDRRPRRDHVAERRPADSLFELGDQLRGEAVREDGKGPLEDEPHQLPVTGDGILARRHLGHPAVGRERRRRGGLDPPRSTTRPSPSERSVGTRQPDVVSDVAERIAAAIAVTVSVRQLADAHAVEDDDDGPAGNGRLRQTRQPSCVE